MNSLELLVHIVAPATVHDDSKYYSIARSLIDFKPAIVTKVSQPINQSREISSRTSSKIYEPPSSKQRNPTLSFKQSRTFYSHHPFQGPSGLFSHSNESKTNSKRKFDLEEDVSQHIDHVGDDSADRTGSLAIRVYHTPNLLPPKIGQNLMVNDIQVPRTESSHKRIRVESSSLRSVGSYVSNSQSTPKIERKFHGKDQPLRRSSLLLSGHFRGASTSKSPCGKSSSDERSKERRRRLNYCPSCRRTFLLIANSKTAQDLHQPALDQALQIIDGISAFPNLISPPECTMRMQKFNTHVTQDLRDLVTRFPLAKYFHPNYFARDIRASERGRWQFEIPVAADEVVHAKREQQCIYGKSWSRWQNFGVSNEDGAPQKMSSMDQDISQENFSVAQMKCLWTMDEFCQFWNACSKFIGGGNAGWEVRVIKEVGPVEVIPNRGAQNAAIVRVVITVFSWAKLIGNIWLAIWMLSEKRSSEIPMSWIGADGTVVASTGVERIGMNRDKE